MDQKSPYHLLPLSILAMAVAFLTFSGSSTSASALADIDEFERTDQATEYAYNLAVVPSVRSAQSANLITVLNLDAVSFNDTDAIDLDRTVDVASSTQTLEGAFADAFERVNTANSLIRFDPTPDYYMADERSPDHHQRALARCPKS